MSIFGRTLSRLTPLLAVFVVMLALMGTPDMPARGQSGESISVARSVDPSQGEFGQVEFDVALTLTGDRSACQAQAVSRPTDIILVLDRSDSMSEPAGGNLAGSKFDALKVAAKNFVNRVDLNRDRIGVVAFDAAASTVSSISSDKTILQQAIDEIILGQGTGIDAGVIAGTREFDTSGRKDTARVLVVLTDGQQSRSGSSNDDVLRAAKEARNQGLRIITIGLGSNADEQLLQGMASQRKDYYKADQASDLDQIYTTIAQVVIEPVLATQVVYNHKFDASTLEVVPDSINPPGDVSGGTITWKLSNLLDDPVTLTYKVHPLAPGQTEIGHGDEITYQRCADPSSAQQISFEQGLPIRFQAPPTPTLRPTLTPAPPPTPTPLPAPASLALQNIQTIFCDSSWWPFLLGILLLLFMLWWLWRMFQELRKPAHEQHLCRLILWLLIPILLLILSQVLGVIGACDARETVYFWRIDERGNKGIFTTDLSGKREAQQFTALDQETCVGCHTVSSTSHRIAAINNGLGGKIVVYALDGTPIQIPDQNASYLSWSPDGDKLAFSDSQLDIQILDLTTMKITKLNGASDPAVAELMPTWSPDGQTIAFARGSKTLNVATFNGPCDIYVVAATGGTAVPLPGASGDGFNYYPSFSPDGRWLAFTRHTTGTTTYAAPEADVFVVPSTGGPAIRLAANDAPGKQAGTLSNSWPTWSQDGRFLAFNSKRNDSHYDIFVTEIGTNGTSGPAIPLQSAAQPGIFEHLPSWGEPPQRNLIAGILGLWPWLIPLLLVLLAYWLCKRRPQPVQPPEQVAVPPPPGALPPLQFTPLWQVAPTLIIGAGGTGRMVLTQLKKGLRDGGGGQLPSGVRFVLLDTSELEQTNIFRDIQGRSVGVKFAGVGLDHHEVLLMGQNLSAVIEHARTEIDQGLESWFPYEYYQQLPVGQRNLGTGTGGRRPLARAGLIDKLVGAPGATGTEAPNNDATQLWERLVEGCQAAYDEKGQIVRIIIVGSLAGGMSGTIADLAYLARCAAAKVIPKDGTTYIEGYFATPEVFNQVAANNEQLRINAAATLRELQRFQLNQGFAFPMIYQSGAEAGEKSYRNDVIRVPMFDYLTLFGGRGEPERGSKKSDEPWATALASMADTIALRLDRAVNAGAQGDYRVTIRNDGLRKQINTGNAVVASAGSYAIRVPIVDIQEIVEARWARKLLHIFLNGTVESALPSFDPADANMSVAAGNYAKQFVLGQHDAGEAPRGMPTVAYLAAHSGVRARDVIALSGDEGRPYYDYLGYALRLVLNGVQSSGSFERRAPRLGYAQEFIRAIQQYLTDALTEAKVQLASAPTGGSYSWLQRIMIWFGSGKANQAEWHQLIARLEAWSLVTSRAGASLQTMRGLLIGADGAGNPETSLSLYQELALRQTRADQRREQMDLVAVRRYLWQRPKSPDRDPTEAGNQVDLVDDWYAQVEPLIVDHLRRFQWTVDRSGTLSLRLVTFREDVRSSIALDERPASVSEIADEIARLAKIVTKDLPASAHLRDLLPTLMPSKEADPAAGIVTLMWRAALPHAQYARTPNQTIDGDVKAVVGLPPEINEGGKPHPITVVFENIGGPRTAIDSADDPIPATPIASTDRTAITLVREYNLMPLKGLPEYQELWRSYLRNAGRSNDTLVESPLLATVFAAESASLQYERRLEKGLRQDFRQLHPIIVLGLARPDLAELYLLAFAAGWIDRRGREPLLRLPHGQEFSLALPVAGDAINVDPRVAGLLRVVSNDAIDRTLIATLREAIAQADRPTRQAWRNFALQFQPAGISTVPTPPPAPRVCINNHPLEPDEKFCGICGGGGKEPLMREGRICTNNHPMEPDAKFCGVCGAPMRPAPSVPPPPIAQPIPVIDLEAEPLAVRDLIAVTALAAYKQIAPNEWDDLVMDRSRRV
ncbi:MAG: tubulin-like doman-containing protein [Chloroflexales bacterium]